MLKKCLSLFITGIILIAVGGIGIATLAMNGIDVDIFKIVRGEKFTVENVTILTEAVMTNNVTIDETEEIHSLDFSSDVGVFKIIRGEGFSIDTNNKTFSWELKDGCLKIENTSPDSFFKFNDEASEIIVTVPERHFKEVHFSLNAGEFYADNISATDFAEITVDAGNCTFNKCIFNNSEINMDAGKMSFEGCRLTGKNNIDIDLGEATFTLHGKRSDYILDINNDLGQVTIDGTNITKGEKIDNTDVNESAGTINIELDLGNCNIDFTE